MEEIMTNTATLVLASSSPRRKEMLNALGIPFVTCASEIDESLYDDLPVSERVVALAQLKARTSMKICSGSGLYSSPFLVIGADTLVSLDGNTMGKAATEYEAREMLQMLSGKTHTVSTGLCMISSSSEQTETFLSETKVSFSTLSEGEIDWYLARGEWIGAAGAYRMQESASFFVERIEGSFSGVVGLPLHAFYAILRKFGYKFPIQETADKTI